MEVKVTKLTDVSLLQRANSFTTGRDSRMSLERAYRHGHSPIRTQLFWIECTEIPLFVASQIVRSHVGTQCFQLSKRTDRGGADFKGVCSTIAEHVSTLESDDIGGSLHVQICNDIEKLYKHFDRYAPTDLAMLINAEALINMAHKRLCAKASKETRDLVKLIASEVASVDAALAPHLVPQCVFRGGICPEPKSCLWIHSLQGSVALDRYISLFNGGK